MYKWVDESGTITFKDTPPPKSKKRGKVKVYSDTDFVPRTTSCACTASREQKDRQLRDADNCSRSGQTSREGALMQDYEKNFALYSK